MAIPDMPNVPPQNVPVLIAQANQAQSIGATTTRTAGVCYPVPNDNYSAENGLDPINSADFYLQQYEHRTVTEPATVTILQQPKHGILRLVTEADRGKLFSVSAGPIKPDNQAYVYLPEKGYLGNDKAVMLVEIGGIKVKVIYFLQAVEGPLGSYGRKEYCINTGSRWKISTTNDANGNFVELKGPSSNSPPSLLPPQTPNQFQWTATFAGRYKAAATQPHSI